MPILRRWGDDGSLMYGSLEIAGTERLLALEQPWLRNVPSRSCVPPGRYQLRRSLHAASYPTAELLDVPGRTGRHITREALPLYAGCVAVGESWSACDGAIVLAGCESGHNRLMDALDWLWKVGPVHLEVLAQ